MENNLNFFGFFETPTILQKLLLLSKKEWKDNNFYSTNCKQYTKTDIIPLVGPNWKTKDEEYIKNYYNLFEKEIILLNNFFLHKFKRGFFSRFVIVRLPCRSIISSHIDNEDTQNNSRRFLIPIMTCPEVYYDVGEESRQLAANEIWEINSSAKFGLRNYSHIENIHLTADWTLEE
jgi:hypothetical protein